MELKIVGTNMELTPAVRRYVERKLGKLNRHFPNIIESKVEIAEEKTRSPEHHYLVRVNLMGSGTHLHGEERGDDLFAAIDKVTATMTRQLEHYKGKRYEKRRGSSPIWGGFSTTPEVIDPAPQVVKVKRFVMKPMSLTEAAEQMELLGHDFFLFLNAEAGKLNLLYRRKDGNYGLIEPEMG